MFAVFLHKSHIWEKSGSWDMDQNALGQSDCRIFKSTISLEQIDKKTWFFACWYRFMEIKSWLKNIEVGVVKSMCGHLRVRTLKLALSQEAMNGINWFLVCWYKFKKDESSCSNFLVVVFKNRVWTFRSWDSKICCIWKMNLWNELIFYMWYNFRKAKITLIVIRWACSKTGEAL